MFGRFTLMALCVASSACSRIPSDFHRHMLPEKIAIYERHFRLGGVPNQDAEWSIAWHGAAAANAMIPYLNREKTGFSIVTASAIVEDVVAMGCDLKGSKVEAVLRRLATADSLRPYEKSSVQDTLSLITEALPPRVPASGYGFGACAPKRKS